MPEFTNLASLYLHLESHAHEYYPREISRFFRTIKPTAETGSPTLEMQQVEWEADFFDVHFETGDTKNIDFESWTQDKCNFMITRLKSSRNPVFKARYSHMLWCGPETRHSDYGKLAVDSYLELVGVYESQQIERPAAHHGQNLLSVIINAHALAFQLKWRIDECRAEIRRIILGFPYDNPLSVHVRRGLIEYMLKGKRKFSASDFRDIDGVCWKIAEKLIDSRKEEVAQDFLELGARAESRMDRASHRWARKKAECSEALMERRKNTPNEIFHWQEALEAYETVGDCRKVEELKGKYYDVRARMPVGHVSIQYEPASYLAKCDAASEEIARLTSREILEFLSGSTQLLPRHELLKRIANDQSQHPHVVDRMNLEVLDERGHKVRRYMQDSEKHRAKVIQSYGIQLECFTIEMLMRLFAAAIREAKLSAEILLEFLGTHTWLGQVIQRRLPGRETKKYRWLDLIAPSVKESMRDIEDHIQNPLEPRHCILAVDSLTLKIEGLLRDLCESHGIKTWQMKRQKGQILFSEKDLGTLLYDEAVAKLLHADDLLFLQFLLVEQAGYNLRNRVAHALLMSHEDYRIDYCVWGLLALLRLGSYTPGKLWM